MFDISFSELMVIGAIALIVIGPARLPKVARTIGHLMGRAQRYVNDVKADIQREVELDELRKFKDQMSDAARDVQSSLREGETALRATHDSVRAEVESVAEIAASTTSAASEAPETPAASTSAEPAALPPSPTGKST